MIYTDFRSESARSNFIFTTQYRDSIWIHQTGLEHSSKFGILHPLLGGIINSRTSSWCVVITHDCQISINIYTGTSDIGTSEIKGDMLRQRSITTHTLRAVHRRNSGQSSAHKCCTVCTDGRRCLPKFNNNTKSSQDWTGPPVSSCLGHDIRVWVWAPGLWISECTGRTLASNGGVSHRSATGWGERPLNMPITLMFVASESECGGHSPAIPQADAV